MTFIWLPLGLISIVAIFGIVLFTPEQRANLLIWRGKSARARNLLESLLQQNPEKMQLYRKLARIYYLENRRDRKAVKIFEFIVKFKIPFEWRDELYTVIAKHYIVEGRKDTEAIRLIEKAVNKELKRLKQYAPNGV